MSPHKARSDPGFFAMLSGIISKGYPLAQKSIFELDLVRIAKWHRRCSILAAIMIFVWMVAILLAVNSLEPNGSLEIALNIFLAISTIASIVVIIGLRRAMGSNILSLILYAILAFALNVLMLLVVASSAGIIIRLAGVKSGFLGVSPDPWDKLRPGHCRKCGYSRESLETLQECPECRRGPQVI